MPGRPDQFKIAVIVQKMPPNLCFAVDELPVYMRRRMLNAAMQRLEGARPRDSQVASVSSSRSTRPRASLSTSEANDPDSTIDLYREIALSLVEAGANLDWTPDGGKSAREIAVWLGFDELIEARDKASKAR